MSFDWKKLDMQLDDLINDIVVLKHKTAILHKELNKIRKFFNVRKNDDDVSDLMSDLENVFMTGSFDDVRQVVASMEDDFENLDTSD